MVGYNILTAVVIVLFGYFLGSIQNGVIIGKLFFKKDPRDYGSHNSGGTNSGRLFGEKIGILVIFLDMMKGVIAFWSVWAILRFSGLREVLKANDPNGVGLWDDGVLYNWMVFLGVTIGHCWTCYYHFKGGKAVAVYNGSLGGTSWLSFIYAAIAFLPIYKTKKIVSYASVISGGITLTITWILAIAFQFTGWREASSIFMWNFGLDSYGPFICWEEAAVLTVNYLILVIRHKANIERMRSGTEKPINY
jgi:acyl phosphate:glycerol-3-phosphate acyltransferase